MATSLIRFYIFRHGETDWNREQRFQGHLDIPLNAHGRAQAHELARALAKRGIDAVITSDLLRARETGEIVAQACGVDLTVTEALREAHLGDAQGMTREQIEAKFGEELLTRWRSATVGDADVKYPGGETGAQVVGRTFQSIERFARDGGASKVGVSTHGGVVRRILQRLMPEDAPPPPIPNGVLYELQWDQATKLWSYVGRIQYEKKLLSGG